MDPVIEVPARPADLDATRQQLSLVTHGLSAACLCALINELDVGMLVCDAGAALVHANAAGQQELRWGQLLTQEPGPRVCAAVAAQRPALVQAMSAAMAGRRQLLMLKGTTERLPLAVLPLTSAQGAPPRVLLMLGRPAWCPGWWWRCCAACMPSLPPSSAFCKACSTAGRRRSWPRSSASS